MAIEEINIFLEFCGLIGNDLFGLAAIFVGLGLFGDRVVRS